VRFALLNPNARALQLVRARACSTLPHCTLHCVFLTMPPDLLTGSLLVARTLKQTPTVRTSFMTRTAWAPTLRQRPNGLGQPRKQRDVRAQRRHHGRLLYAQSGRRPAQPLAPRLHRRFLAAVLLATTKRTRALSTMTQRGSRLASQDVRPRARRILRARVLLSVQAAAFCTSPRWQTTSRQGLVALTRSTTRHASLALRLQARQ